MLHRSAIAVLAALTAPAMVLAMASAAAAGPQDRYGPPMRDEPEPGDAVPTSFLSWPGKATPPPATTQAAAPSPARALPTSLYAPPPRLRPQIDARAVPVLRPLRAAPATAPAVKAVRTASLGADPHPARAPVQPQSAPATNAPAPTRPQPAAAAASNLPPHFYSVSREFGAKPDPIPLPAQFFADSGATDLAGPPPPPAPHLIAGQSASSAANVQRATAAADISGEESAPSNSIP
jgi:hypothetical protein